MNSSSILDLGGDTSARSVSSSHLGSGSPSILADAYHPKRAKRYSEESEVQVTRLKAKLCEDVSDLLKTSSFKRLYAVIYTDVEHLCIMRHSEQALMTEFLFREIDDTLSLLIVPQVSKCLQDFTKESAVKTAEELLKIHSDWNKTLRLLLQVFLYLDRSYLLHHPTHPSIQKYGMDRFKDRLMVQVSSLDTLEKSNDPLCALVSILLGQSREDRSNSTLYDIVTRLLATLDRLDPENTLNVNNSLEAIFMSDYTKLLKIWRRDKKNYVCSLLASLNDDGILLTRASKRHDLVMRISSTLRWNFLLSDLNFFLEPSLPVLIQPQNLEYLHAVRCFCDTSMAEFFVDSTKILVTMWGRLVQGKSNRLPLDSNIVPNILKLWNQLIDVCARGFKDEAFEFEVRSALIKTFARKDFASIIVVHLSKFCDGIMKQTNKSDEVFAVAEYNMLTILKLLLDKLAFITVYGKDLSKRILMGKNFNFTLEKQLVDAIVSVVGESDENFRLRAMLRDYSSSKNLFSHLALPCAPQMDFNALVLEQKVWPEIPGLGPETRLPQALLSTLREFEKQFFATEEKHKVLDWKNYTLHQITLSTKFASESRELQVNLLQAIVLLLFEDTDAMSVSQILKKTVMSDRLLKRVLESLSSDRYPILLVDGDCVTFNKNFSDKASKIKLPMGKERDVTTVNNVRKLVQQGRSSETRSALVRIMKAHKSLPFTVLLGKTIDALSPRGTPQIHEIKTEIEYLILTDYIARDVEGTTLSYIP